MGSRVVPQVWSRAGPWDWPAPWALAAVQILPTLELSRLSIRSGGLSYREAVAFSLSPLPRLLRYTFLPPWGRNLRDVFGGDFYTEYVANMGLLPLLLAGLGGCLSGRAMRRGKALDTDPRTLVLAAHDRPCGSGSFLALGLYNPLYWVLYKVVPGFSLFRVPARWLLLYAFGAAMLAGAGFDLLRAWIARHLGRGTGQGICPAAGPGRLWSSC